MYFLTSIGTIPIIIFLFLGLLLYKIFKADSRKLQNNWSQYIDKMQFSTDEFYNRLQKEIASANIEHLLTENVTLSEGGITSSNRKYFRVNYKDFQYDVCFMNFGNSAAYISCWLWRTPTGFELIFSAIPFFGIWLNRFFFTETYYRIDSANSFMHFIQSKVLKVLDEIIKEQNITALPEFERYPMKQALHNKK